MPAPHPETVVVAPKELQAADLALVRGSVVVTDGPDLGLSHPLGERVVRVGKGKECDVVLTDRAVSRLHLELSLQGSAVRVKDLGSTNGTFVGKTRLIESVVPIGTVLQMGQTRLHLRSDDLPEVLAPSTADRFGDLWGHSLAMRQVFAVLERVAAKDASLFVDGETGTGKELVARAIHQQSGRKAGPFVVLDCSAVAPELIESQLFGHRRGAFTGAMQDRPGVFESARGGTLFLDELDSLPLDLQPKLLRVIESRMVVRLGEYDPRPVDVRLVAASGRSPEEGVAKNELRRDLYFRLAVVRVTLPALRDRLDDLPLLAQMILQRIGNNHIVVEDGPAMVRLKRHPWPGNVRELRNVLERALLLAPTGATSLEQLSLRLSPVMAGAVPTPEGGGRWLSVDMSLPYKEAKDQALAAFEKDYLRAALQRHGTNLSKMSREVGLTRHHLRKLLRDHRLVAGGDADPTKG